MTGAHLRVVVMGLACAGMAVLLHRPDLAVFATPLLIIAAWGIARRPNQGGAVTVRDGAASAFVMLGSALPWHIDMEGLDGWETLGHDPLLPKDCSRNPPAHTCYLHGPQTQLTYLLEPRRRGLLDSGQGPLHLRSPWGAWETVVAPQSLLITVAPAPGPLELTARFPHTSQLLGLHASRRRGEGAEFNDIRPFTPGDSTRTIHWPTTARTGHLHVRSTYAEADASILIVVDAFATLPDVADSDSAHLGQAETDSLTRSVLAASSLAAWCTRSGDRVGLRLLGTASQPIPPGSGRGHFMRLLAALGSFTAGSDHTAARRKPAIPVDPGTLAVFFTPLLEKQVGDVAVAMAAGGADVIIMDTGAHPTAAATQAPSGLQNDRHHRRLSMPGAYGREAELRRSARALVDAQRALHRDALIAAGITVQEWAGAASVEMAVARLAAGRGCGAGLRWGAAGPHSRSPQGGGAL